MQASRNVALFTETRRKSKHLKKDEVEDEGITIDEVIQRTAEEERKFESFWIGIQNGIDAHTQNANYGGIKHLTHRKKKINNSWVFNPDHNSKVLWDILLLGFVFYTVIIIPLRIGFDLQMTTSEINTEIFITALFGFDIFISFNTAYLDYNIEQLVYDRIKIAKFYLKFWFWVDLLATIPFDMIIGAFYSSNGFGAIRAIRIFRMIRLFKLYRIVRHNGLLNKLHIEPALMNLMTLIFQIFFIAHFFACFWHYIGNHPPYNHENTWINSFSYEESLIGTRYIASFYYTIVTMLTVGYGDIYATNPTERIYAILTIFVGTIIFGALVGKVNSILSVRNPQAKAYKESLDEFKSFIADINLPTNIANRAKEAYSYYLKKKSTLGDSGAFDNLPKTLEVDLFWELFHDDIKHIKLFQTLDQAFVVRIMQHARPFQAYANEIIFDEGDVCNDIIFVKIGLVRIATHDGMKHYIISGYILEGGFFGDSEYICNVCSIARYSAVNHCHLFAIHHTVFKNAMNESFAIATNLNNMIKLRHTNLKLVLQNRVTAMDKYLANSGTSKKKKKKRFHAHGIYLEVNTDSEEEGEEDIKSATSGTENPPQENDGNNPSTRQSNKSDTSVQGPVSLMRKISSMIRPIGSQDSFFTSPSTKKSGSRSRLNSFRSFLNMNNESNDGKEENEDKVDTDRSNHVRFESDEIENHKPNLDISSQSFIIPRVSSMDYGYSIDPDDDSKSFKENRQRKLTMGYDVIPEGNEYDDQDETFIKDSHESLEQPIINSLSSNKETDQTSPLKLHKVPSNIITVSRHDDDSFTINDEASPREKFSPRERVSSQISETPSELRSRNNRAFSLFGNLGKLRDTNFSQSVARFRAFTQYVDHPPVDPTAPQELTPSLASNSTQLTSPMRALKRTFSMYLHRGAHTMHARTTLWIDGDIRTDYDIMEGKTIPKSIRIVITESEGYESIQEAPISVFGKYNLINPRGIYKLYWDAFVGIWIIYSVIFVPIELGFGQLAYSESDSVNWFIFAVFALDMFTSFFTSFESVKHDAYMISKTKIAKYYFKTWFWVDFVSTIPFDQIISSAITENQSTTELSFAKIIKVVRILRLLKLARILKLGKYLNDVEEKIGISPTLFQLLFLLVEVFFIAHWIACFWWGVTSSISADPWYNYYDIVDKSLYVRYITTLYYVIVTICTVGYGDIHPVNGAERIVCIFLVLIGASFFGYLLGKVSHLLEKYQQNQTVRREYNQSGSMESSNPAANNKLIEIRGFLNEKNVSHKIINKIMNHYKKQYQETLSYDINKLMNRLPPHISNEILYVFYQRKLSKIPIFKYIPIRSVCIYLFINYFKPIHYENGAYLFKEDEEGKDILFLISGNARAFKRINPNIIPMSASQRFSNTMNNDHSRKQESISSKNLSKKEPGSGKNVQNQFYSKFGLTRNNKSDSQLSTTSQHSDYETPNSNSRPPNTPGNQNNLRNFSTVHYKKEDYIKERRRKSATAIIIPPMLFSPHHQSQPSTQEKTSLSLLSHNGPASTNRRKRFSFTDYTVNLSGKFSSTLNPGETGSTKGLRRLRSSNSENNLASLDELPPSAFKIAHASTTDSITLEHKDHHNIFHDIFSGHHSHNTSKHKMAIHALAQSSESIQPNSGGIHLSRSFSTPSILNTSQIIPHTIINNNKSNFNIIETSLPVIPESNEISLTNNLTQSIPPPVSQTPKTLSSAPSLLSKLFTSIDEPDNDLPDIPIIHTLNLDDLNTKDEGKPQFLDKSRNHSLTIEVPDEASKYDQKRSDFSYRDISGPQLTVSEKKVTFQSPSKPTSPPVRSEDPVPQLLEKSSSYFFFSNPLKKDPLVMASRSEPTSPLESKTKKGIFGYLTKRNHSNTSLDQLDRSIHSLPSVDSLASLPDFIEMNRSAKGRRQSGHYEIRGPNSKNSRTEEDNDFFFSSRLLFHRKKDKNRKEKKYKGPNNSDKDHITMKQRMAMKKRWLLRAQTIFGKRNSETESVHEDEQGGNLYLSAEEKLEKFLLNKSFSRISPDDFLSVQLKYIGEVNPGEFIGHQAFLNHENHKYSIRTTSPSSVYSLSSSDMARLIRIEPTVGVQLQNALTQAIIAQSTLLGKYNMRNDRSAFLKSLKYGFYFNQALEENEVHPANKPFIPTNPTFDIGYTPPSSITPNRTRRRHRNSFFSGSNNPSYQQGSTININAAGSLTNSSIQLSQHSSVVNTAQVELLFSSRFTWYNSDEEDEIPDDQGRPITIDSKNESTKEFRFFPWKKTKSQNSASNGKSINIDSRPTSRTYPTGLNHLLRAFSRSSTLNSSASKNIFSKKNRVDSRPRSHSLNDLFSIFQNGSQSVIGEKKKRNSIKGLHNSPNFNRRLHRRRQSFPSLDNDYWKLQNFQHSIV